MGNVRAPPSPAKLMAVSIASKDGIEKGEEIPFEE